MWMFYVTFVCLTFGTVASRLEDIRHRFVRGSFPERFGIDTCISPQNLSQYVTSFLDTCTVTSPFVVRGFGECQGRCTQKENCVAFAYTTSDRMCTHCNESEEIGQGLKLPHCDVMIAMEPFGAYINRKLYV